MHDVEGLGNSPKRKLYHTIVDKATGIPSIIKPATTVAGFINSVFRIYILSMIVLKFMLGRMAFSAFAASG
jgi:hypothetical protein